MNFGIPIVLSAPSGAGKSTIAERVLAEWPKATRSISCTTRPPRADEKNGVDYFFISELDFQIKIKRNDFIEWATVHGNYYGTPKHELDKQILAGRDILLVIDPQGAVSIKKHYPEGIYIFIVPPTWDVLRERLTNRGSETPETLEKRLLDAKQELTYLSYYQYIVVNDDVEKAVSEVLAIIRAEHRRSIRVNRKDIPFLWS